MATVWDGHPSGGGGAQLGVPVAGDRPGACGELGGAAGGDPPGPTRGSDTAFALERLRAVLRSRPSSAPRAVVLLDSGYDPVQVAGSAVTARGLPDAPGQEPGVLSGPGSLPGP